MRGEKEAKGLGSYMPLWGQLGIQLQHLCESLSMRLARLIGFGL